MAREGIKFWGMVGVVMTALKLKDSYDDYQQLPQSELQQPRAGPIALRSPIEGEAVSSQGVIELDTTLLGVGRPKRKRRADCCCCVCCGFRCGIFWTAFGLVVLLVVIWQAILLVLWAVKATPTGLENMPEFGTSLICQNPSYVFNPYQKTYYIPFNLSQASHSVQLRGDAFGTFVVTNGAKDATDIEYDFVLRSSDESMLQSVVFNYPTRDEVDDGSASSHVLLETPPNILDQSSCMRFDIFLRVPPQLKELSIQTSSLSHIKFEPSVEIDLDKLDIAVHAPYGNNLVLPSSSVRAKNLSILIRKGYLVGDVSIVNSTSIDTTYGDAISNLYVYPSSGTEDDGVATLSTLTGDGRSEFFYMFDSGSGAHRQIASKHTSKGTGELYLKYEKSEFSGKVEVKAGSSTVYGMHTVDFHKSFTKGWVGEEDGKDRISATSGRQGWVGLYF
ncbi:hypothetical protein BC835DRAFT_1280069 [Cytidiella melzeri]|nr:hypothetical protein BC835DRAFT_1280069 [Cytidiella melzeri]